MTVDPLLEDLAGNNLTRQFDTDLDQKVASLLGTSADQVRIHDMAVHPRTGNLFLSVSRVNGAAEAAEIKSRRAGQGTSHPIRIFHTAYGSWETGAPARVFVPYERSAGPRDPP